MLFLFKPSVIYNITRLAKYALNLLPPEHDEGNENLNKRSKDSEHYLNRDSGILQVIRVAAQPVRDEPQGSTQCCQNHHARRDEDSPYGVRLLDMNPKGPCARRDRALRPHGEHSAQVCRSSAVGRVAEVVPDLVTWIRDVRWPRSWAVVVLRILWVRFQGITFLVLVYCDAVEA